MFGFKIISTKQYNRLQENISKLEASADFLTDVNTKLGNDCASLREQLNDNITLLAKRDKEILELQHKLESVKSSDTAFLKDFIVLRPNCSQPCHLCSMENKPCKCLEFCDRFICVCHKDDARSFRSFKQCREQYREQQHHL